MRPFPNSMLSALVLALLGAGCAANISDEAADEDPLSGSVVASFQDGVAPSAGYAGETDTTLVQATPTAAHGSDASLAVDRDTPSGSGQASSALVRFDLSSIPNASTVQAVTLTFNVTNPTGGHGYNLYAVSHTWSPSQATWNNSAAGTPWASAGAQGGADRSGTVLGTVLPTVNGKYSVSLNAEGIKVVQGWVKNPATNFGFSLDHATNMDGLAVDSSHGATASNRPRLQVSYDAPAADGTGLLGQYFVGTNFETLGLTRTDPTINFNWAAGAPASGVPSDGFSVRWTGKVLPRYSETYTFAVTSDDGARLWVNGQAITNDWNDHSASSASGTVALTAGTQYDIKLEYYEHTGGAQVSLAWASPSQRAEIIPASQLFPATPPPASPPPASGTDADGVQMLFPTQSGGATWALGTQNPNTLPTLTLLGGVKATPGTDGPIHFWNTPTFTITYANSMVANTGRWQIHANGGSQLYTWLTQHGFLSDPKNLKNQEFTAYVRIHDLDAAHLALQGVHLKIRGGRHVSDAEGDLASCVMMEYRPSNAGTPTRFAKELHHPDYDYVPLTPKVSDSLTDNKWVGLKIVSYVDPGNAKQVINRLYTDASPFTSAGKPANNWKLASEYIDVEGKSTGKYTKLVDWGAYETTLRVDAMKDYDVAILSAREIVPPRG